MTSSQAWSLAFGIIAVLVILAFGVGARRKIAIGALLILIPFQLVETRYGSSSVLMAYALAGVLALTGGLKLRMLPAIGLIVVGYSASFAMADEENLLFNAAEMFQFFSGLVVFILAYNFARLVETERSVIDILLIINGLVVAYCLLQFTVGPGERFTPLGIDSLAFNPNRTPDDPRLVGAFGNPGSTAGYFTLMTLVCAADYMFARGRRKLLVQLLIGMNLLGLIATSNRTGFLILVAIFPAFLYVFRRELGAKRLAAYALGGVVAVVVASAVAIFYTDFGRMFSRLGNVTEMEQGVPSTRSETWPVAIEKIKQDPWFGEGPYFPSAHELQKGGELRVEFENLGALTTSYDPYPHSLYLYLLRTVGIVGLIPVVGFFLGIWGALYSSSRRDDSDGYGLAMVRLGLLLVPAFLVAQVTLEFNRSDTIDYAQFILALMGLLVGISDRRREPVSVAQVASNLARREPERIVGNFPTAG